MPRTTGFGAGDAGLAVVNRASAKCESAGSSEGVQSDPSKGSQSLPQSSADSDATRGTEPVPVPIDDSADKGVVRALRTTFQRYVSDSVLPDGTCIADIRYRPDASHHGIDATENISPASPLSDDGSSLSSIMDGPDDCACACSDKGSACRATGGDQCECVAEYGNFYRTIEAPVAGGPQQVLDIVALPERWPLVECGPACECDTACQNRLTQTGVRVPMLLVPGPSGMGLALRYRPLLPVELPKGSFISLYAGEYLSTEQARERWAAQAIASASTSQVEGQGNYILSLRLPDGTVHIDPRHIGNVGRFLNHSCEANCLILPVRWGRGPGIWPRAAIFTKRDTRPGEELTFDYANASGSAGMQKQLGEAGAMRKEDMEEQSTTRTRCLCGSGRCKGWMPFDESLS